MISTNTLKKPKKDLRIDLFKESWKWQLPTKAAKNTEGAQQNLFLKIGYLRDKSGHLRNTGVEI